MCIPGGGGYHLQPPLAPHDITMNPFMTSQPPHDIIMNPLMMSPQTLSNLHFSNFYFGGHLKVSARVKEGEFSKFLISRCSDKAFQDLSFKKKSSKKYYFSAKLLDFEVYYRLIVLITH